MVVTSTSISSTFFTRYIFNHLYSFSSFSYSITFFQHDSFLFFPFWIISSITTTETTFSYVLVPNGVVSTTCCVSLLLLIRMIVVSRKTDVFISLLLMMTVQATLTTIHTIPITIYGSSSAKTNTNTKSRTIKKRTNVLSCGVEKKYRVKKVFFLYI